MERERKEMKDRERGWREGGKRDVDAVAYISISIKYFN
jgi:hypothetical protein